MGIKQSSLCLLIGTCWNQPFHRIKLPNQHHDRDTIYRIQNLNLWSSPNTSGIYENCVQHKTKHGYNIASRSSWHERNRHQSWGNKTHVIPVGAKGHMWFINHDAKRHKMSMVHAVNFHLLLCYAVPSTVPPKIWSHHRPMQSNMSNMKWPNKPFAWETSPGTWVSTQEFHHSHWTHRSLPIVIEISAMTYHLLLHLLMMNHPWQGSWGSHGLCLSEEWESSHSCWVWTATFGGWSLGLLHLHPHTWCWSPG